MDRAFVTQSFTLPYRRLPVCKSSVRFVRFMGPNAQEWEL